MPTFGGGDPAGEFAGLEAGLHQRLDVVAVGRGGQPLGGAGVPGRAVDELAFGADALVGEHADLAVEALVRQLQLELDARRLDDLVPAPDAAGCVAACNRRAAAC